jgi:hypothetical protein
VTRPSTTEATADRELVVAVVHDYYAAWWTADVARMDGALHPALVKRAARSNLDVPLTKQRMLALTEQGQGRSESDHRLDVDVTDVHDDIAACVARTAVYREYLHLISTADGWRILDAFWQFAQPSIAG